MNLPNKLTMTRIIMVPIFMALMLCQQYVWALVVFSLASITDFLDGYLARKYNLVSSVGKIMDPLADKLLTFGALVCFIQLEVVSVWAPIIIIAREFIISGFRLVASDNGIVIAASYWGKFKTVSHMAMVILMILDFQSHVMQFITGVVVGLGLALTIVSLVDYVWKNKQVLTQGGM